MEKQTNPRRQVPAAPLIGPFAQASFLDTVWRHTAPPGGQQVCLSDDQGSVTLAVEGEARRIGLVGHEDLVDYRSPVGESQPLLAEFFASLEPGWHVRFDSLPAESVPPFQSAMSQAGFGNRHLPHGSTAVIDLPASYDQYLTAVGKKERHEIRRKLRRFTAELGAPRLVTLPASPGPELEQFFSYHRQSPGPKGSFMTPARQALFADLLSLPGWRLDTLVGQQAGWAAAAFGFADDHGYYLYNSAYHPDYGSASPGMVMLAILIEEAIDHGLQVFDFLKGEESYKYRLGARSRPLYVVEGMT